MLPLWFIGLIFSTDLERLVFMVADCELRSEVDIILYDFSRSDGRDVDILTTDFIGLSPTMNDTCSPDILGLFITSCRGCFAFRPKG